MIIMVDATARREDGTVRELRAAVCTSAGLLRRIEPAGHPARFERRVGDKHHHVVCRRCGRTEDTDCAVGERPCLEPAEQHGFVVDGAEVVFWGLCPACQATAASSAGTVGAKPG
jgi:Fe2+ or Zn2+ uptake regulation protein